MRVAYAQQGRAERVIGVARVALALIWSVALSIPPEGGVVLPQHVALRTLSWSFLVFSIVILLVSWKWVNIWRWSLFAHVADALFFTGVVFATGGPGSPFTFSLLFPVVSASFVFLWRGALASGTAMIAAFLASAFVSGNGDWLALLPAQVIVMRVAAFTVVSAIIVYGGWHKQKLERELLALADWPYDPATHVPTRELLEHAQRVFGAPRLLLAWEESEEPWLHLAWLFDTEFRWIRESPAKYDPIVADTLFGLHFIARRLDTQSPHVIAKVDVSLVPVKVEPIHASLRKNFRMSEVLALSLDGSTFHGRLFILDRLDVSSDDLIAGEILARFVVSRMDHYFLLQKAQQVAVGEERIRLSRDLHDGVLQSLTGAALQLEAVRAMISGSPDEAKERLGGIQAELANDQRELRSFIRQLRPNQDTRSTVDSRLTARLATLSERFKKQWNVKVDLNTEALSPALSSALRHELYSLVNEAVVNAAKHAQASEVTVRIASRDQEIQVVVRDNGHGFPFRGRYDLNQLTEIKRGPVTLKERVASLGGNLIVDSTPQGSQIEMYIPANWGA